MLDALGAGKKDFTAAHYDALAALCAGSGTAQLDLPGGVTARRADGVLTLCAHRRETPERVLLRTGETVRWGGFAITCRKCEKTVENSENTVILRGADLDEPLSVGAVSYTHLDVYKRQLFKPRDGGSIQFVFL